MALRMKKLSNDICDKLGGRTIHPNRLVPGGFTKLPSTADLTMDPRHAGKPDGP